MHDHKTVKPVLNVLFIARASLFTVKGGDTTQVLKTAEALRESGVIAEIRLSTDKHINYAAYSLIHFFNIRHPADMIRHIKKSGLPYVVSTIYVDYSRPPGRKNSG